MDRIIGDFDDYLAFQKEQQKEAQQVAAASTPKQTQPPKKRKKGLSYKEKREYETLLERIEQTEQRLTEIDDEMVAASSDYAKVKDLSDEQQQLNERYEADMLRWSELEELKEQ